MKKNLLTLLLLFIFLPFSGSMSAQEADSVKAPTVETTDGMISGTMQEGTFSYLGIPYARVERFMPPRPVEKWEGVRLCDHFGPQTMQPTNRPMREDEMSEQCCVLNIWTTDTKARKPVMLWLHGGGGKVGTLMCMPAAKGLFHKAIIMSGTILNVNTKAMTEELGKAVVKELGISPENIDRIKDVPYQQLYEAGQRAMAASIGTRKPGTPMMWGFGPTPDGETLLQQPFQPGFAAISDSIPLMIGTTFNELQRLHYKREMTKDEARTELQKTFGDETDAYIAAFAKAHPDYTPQDLLSIDWLFRPKTLITADDRSALRSPLYMYMFTWRSPVSLGSVHGNELCFCFNRLHQAKNIVPQPTADDLRLADLMSSAWAQFAHTGNPNIEGLPAWQPYSKENGELMVFDHRCYIRNNPDRELEQIINRHCFRQLDEFNKNHKK